MSIVDPSTSMNYSSIKSNGVLEPHGSNVVISLSKNFFPLKELTPVIINSPADTKRSSKKNKSLCSGSQLYCDLTSTSVYKRVLINNGNTITKNKKTGSITKIEAVIKLQSFFRMVKIVRKFEDRVSEYTSVRHTLIVETLARRGNWPKTVKTLDYFKKSRIKKEIMSLYPLIEMYNNPLTIKKQKVVIIKFLFLCLLKDGKDNVQAHDITILLIDILCTDIPYSDIEGFHGIFSRPPYNGQVDFLQFYSWYDQFSQKMDKKVSKYLMVYLYINFIEYF